MRIDPDHQDNATEPWPVLRLPGPRSSGTPRPRRRVMLFAGRSGGACKTSHASNIATRLARYGYRVLMIDLDGQCNLSKLFGYAWDTWTGRTVSDVIETQSGAPWRASPESRVTLVDAVQPAMYRDYAQDDFPFEQIPNLWIVPASTRLSDTDSFLATYMDGMNWWTNTLETQIGPRAVDVDVVVIDLPASEGRLVTSTLVEDVEVIGCMAPEGKFYDGVVLAKAAVDKALAQAPSSSIALSAVVIGNHENAHTKAPQIRANRDARDKAIATWGERVLWTVRKAKARMPETYDWQCVMPYFAPEEPVNADYRVVVDQLGFPPLPGTAADEFEARDAALQMAAKEWAEERAAADKAAALEQAGQG